MFISLLFIIEVVQLEVVRLCHRGFIASYTLVLQFYKLSTQSIHCYFVPSGESSPEASCLPSDLSFSKVDSVEAIE